MTKPMEPGLQSLVMGFLHTDQECFEKALALCVDEFGPVRTKLGPFEWDWSAHYVPEMGPGIVRWFYCFEKLVHPGHLPDIKMYTNEVEQRFAVEGRRKVNIDPGLLCPWNLVLATSKPRHQRVYIDKSIFGDLTMVYHTGGYKPLEWTFKDWGSPEVVQFLTDIRNAPKRQGDKK